MKKLFKQSLSLFLALVLALSVLPLVVLAEDNFQKVDYSKFINEFSYDSIDASAPYITEKIDAENNYFSGYANGYYTYLLADNEYVFDVEVWGNNAAFISYALAVLDYDTENAATLAESLIAVEYNSENGDCVAVTVTVTPDKTGYYKLLLWGVCEDSSETQLFGNDIEISVDIYSDVDYTDIDYSYAISPKREYNDYVSAADPFIHVSSSVHPIDWHGTAQGYTIYLNKGVEYEIQVSVTGEGVSYIDHSVAVLKNDFSGDIDEDIVAVLEDTIIGDAVTPLVFTPEATGYYKILSWGYCSDPDDYPVFGETETSIKIIVDTYYDSSYYKIPYDTSLTVGEQYDYFIDYQSEFGNLDNYDGTLEGFTIELEAGKEYILEAVLDGNGDDVYFDVAFLNNELVEYWYDDVVAYAYNRYGELVAKLAFTPETSGTYKIAVCNSVRDNGEQVYGEADTSASIVVREPVKKELNISNASDFEELLTTNADYVTINILKDIDMSGYSLELPEFYKVTINGNFHIINGLSVPLFNYVNTIEASDLEINFDYKFNDELEYIYEIGALAGYVDNAYVYNCHVTGNIDITADDIEDVGGLIGGVYNEGVFEHCTSNVNITIHGEAYYVGGLVGYIDGYETESLFYDCHAYGDIKIDKTDYVRYIGLLVGEADYDIVFESCSAIGTITVEIDPEATSHDFNSIGGLVGYVEDYCRFLNCFADVDINAEDALDVGGFVGYIDEENIFNNCYAEGDVIAYDGVGGFIGVSNCCGYNEIVNCYALGNVTGYEDVGGFIGEIYSDDYFENCYAAGTVTPVDESYTDYIGTFAGYGELYDVEFVDCYAAEGPVFGDVVVYDTEGDAFVEPGGVDVVDFTDADAVKALADIFNANVNAENEIAGEDIFLPWVVDENGVLTFNFPEILSPDKPCKHIVSVGFNGYDDEFHWHECESVNCNHKECSVTGKAKHNGEWKVVKEADKDNDGLKELRCTECDYLMDSEVIPAGGYMLGDINNNGTIDSMDYVLLKRAYFGTYKLKDVAIGDINKNGTIDSMDYVYLRRAYFGTYVIK